LQLPIERDKINSRTVIGERLVSTKNNFDTDSKYYRELRKQIVKLKRENAALRKKNKELENSHAFDPILEEIEQQYQADKEKKKNAGSKCPKCDNVIEVFELVHGMYYKCADCGSKGKYLSP
jgi:regulator of replication initiation timing